MAIKMLNCRIKISFMQLFKIYLHYEINMDAFAIIFLLIYDVLIILLLI